LTHAPLQTIRGASHEVGSLATSTAASIFTSAGDASGVFFSEHPSRSSTIAALGLLV